MNINVKRKYITLVSIYWVAGIISWRDKWIYAYTWMYVYACIWLNSGWSCVYVYAGGYVCIYILYIHMYTWVCVYTHRQII